MYIYITQNIVYVCRLLSLCGCKRGEDKRLLIAADAQVVGEEEGLNFDVRETSQSK